MMRSTKSLITLAVACLLAVPAFSLPWNNGPGCGGRFDQLNLTEEEMENMTLAELRELRQESNMAQCPGNNSQMDHGPMSQCQCPMSQCQCPMNQCQCPMNQCPMNQDNMNQGQMKWGPMNNGPMGGGCGDVLLLMTDLTADEMESMTLGELQNLRQQKMDELKNMTIAEIEALREEKRAEMENMTIAELRETRNNGFCRPFIGGGACLLAADLTVEDLESMTVAEIEDLRQEKMDQLNNMTIAEIEEINENRKAEMENMTIAELKEQMGVCEILGLGNGRMKGHQGCHDGKFWMAGAANYNGMNQGRGAVDGQMNGPGLGGEE